MAHTRQASSCRNEASDLTASSMLTPFTLFTCSSDFLPALTSPLSAIPYSMQAIPRLAGSPAASSRHKTLPFPAGNSSAVGLAERTSRAVLIKCWESAVSELGGSKFLLGPKGVSCVSSSSSRACNRVPLIGNRGVSLLGSGSVWF